PYADLRRAYERMLFLEREPRAGFIRRMVSRCALFSSTKRAGSHTAAETVLRSHAAAMRDSVDRAASGRALPTPVRGLPGAVGGEEALVSKPVFLGR
ncbi:MAG: hypothetical protein ACK559_08085, partial [bacterium]